MKLYAPSLVYLRKHYRGTKDVKYHEIEVETNKWMLEHGYTLFIQIDILSLVKHVNRQEPIWHKTVWVYHAGRARWELGSD